MYGVAHVDTQYYVGNTSQPNQRVQYNNVKNTYKYRTDLFVIQRHVMATREHAIREFQTFLLNFLT